MSSIGVLVADDDKDIVFTIRKILESQGYQVSCAENGRQVLERIEKEKIHLVLLDIMMPEMDGFSTVMKIREDYNIPIILLSAKTEESDKVLGLTMGADDYITKPFSKEELLARIKAQIRRYLDLGNHPDVRTNNKLVNGDLLLDLDTKIFYVNHRPIQLTATEYKIIELLLSHPGKVFTVEEIYEKVWGEEAYQSDNVVMVHIRRIRKKIEIDPKEPRYLKVVWGIGYKIEKQ